MYFYTFAIGARNAFIGWSAYYIGTRWFCMGLRVIIKDASAQGTRLTLAMLKRNADARFAPLAETLDRRLTNLGHEVVLSGSHALSNGFDLWLPCSCRLTFLFITTCLSPLSARLLVGSTPSYSRKVNQSVL